MCVEFIKINVLNKSLKEKKCRYNNANVKNSIVKRMFHVPRFGFKSS